MASKGAVQGSSGNSRSQSTRGASGPRSKKRKADVDETDNQDEVDGGDEGGSEVDLANDPGVDMAISIPDSVTFQTFRQFIWYIPNKHGSPWADVTGSTLSIGWYIVPVQFFGYYLKSSDLQMLSASGRYITVKHLKVTGTNLVATEDQENTASGSLDITTTPSNQPYLMVYIDHKHLMPIMTAEQPFPTCGTSIPPRANAELPHGFSTGPLGYWETADADPMNTPFVKFHHANSKGFMYEASPDMNLPVTAVISDGSSTGSFQGCPMHPDGPDKFYKMGGLPGPEGLVGYHTLPLDNIAAPNAYANRYDNIPLSGVPNYMCSNISARLTNADRPAGQTNTTIEANLNSDLMGRKMDSRIGPVQAAEVSAASGYTGQIYVKEQVTYQGDQFNTQRTPTHISGEGAPMPVVDASKQASEEDRTDGGHGVNKTFKIKAGDFQNYYQQGMNLSNMNYGTAIPYQESLPLMLVKPAPFQTPTGKMHPYSFCVVFSFEATIEVHRNHTRYNYLHTGTRSRKTAVYAGCNVHSNVKTFPQRAWCLG